MYEEYEYAYSTTAGTLKILAVSNDIGNGRAMIAGRNGNKMETWTFDRANASKIGSTIYIERPIVREWIKRSATN